MDDNWRTSIGYICIMLCVVAWLGLLAWMVTPTEFTFKIEMDNNTRNAIESIEYPIAEDIGNANYWYNNGTGRTYNETFANIALSETKHNGGSKWK